MKKMKVFLPVLLLFVLTTQMFRPADSIGATLSLVKPDQEKVTALSVPSGASIEPTAANISVWISISWIFFLVLISIPFYFNYKRIKVRQQIISHLIEKGQEIPKELISRPATPGRSDFHKGIVLIGLGAGIIILLLSLELSNNYWTAGFIPLLLGMAYLISYRFDSMKK